MKGTTNRNATQTASGRLTWALRGRTYVSVPTTPSHLGGLDEERATSMTDEGGPPQPEPAASDTRTPA